MYRRAIQTLFVAATALLLTTTACDKGDDKKVDDKKAEGEKAPEEVQAEAGEAAAEAGAEVEAVAAAEAGAEAGEAAAEAGAGEAGEAVAAAGDGNLDGDAGGDEKADGGENKPEDGGEKKPAGGDGGKTASAPKIDGKPIFEQKCKSCHGIDGKGETTIGKKVGIPSLVKTKLSKGKIVSTIQNGVPDTKMKGYKDKLSKEEIDAVAAYIKKL